MKILIMFLVAFSSLIGQSAIKLGFRDVSPNSSKIIVPLNSDEIQAIYRIEINGIQVPLIKQNHPVEKVGVCHWAKSEGKVIIQLNPVENRATVVVWCIADREELSKTRLFYTESSDGIRSTTAQRFKIFRGEDEI